MPRKKTTGHVSNALVTPAKSSAKKPSKTSARKDSSPSSSLNSSSDRDEFGKLLKSVKKKYERKVEQERINYQKSYQEIFERAMRDLESQVAALKNQTNTRMEVFMREMQTLEEERQSTLKALQDDYAALRVRVEGQVEKLHSRNEAIQKRVASYAKEMKSFYADLEEEKGLVLSEYKQAIKKASKK